MAPMPTKKICFHGTIVVKKSRCLLQLLRSSQLQLVFCKLLFNSSTENKQWLQRSYKLKDTLTRPGKLYKYKRSLVKKLSYSEITFESLKHEDWGPCRVGKKPEARFSKVPKTFRARKAIRKTATRLFCEAVFFVCCKGNKN